MNIEEAIKAIDNLKHEGNLVSSYAVKEIISQIKQEKEVIPQFVAICERGDGMNNQKNFTDKVNEMILYGKSQGLSTKGISDKWHTFGDLYYHRMILTLVIMRQNKDKAWKSKQHHDGTMFDDSFICGINTPKGQYSYHYDLEHWELFNIKELEKAPEYDGHKPEDITRLLSLEAENDSN